MASDNLWACTRCHELGVPEHVDHSCPVCGAVDAMVPTSSRRGREIQGVAEPESAPSIARQAGRKAGKSSGRLARILLIFGIGWIVGVACGGYRAKTLGDEKIDGYLATIKSLHTQNWSVEQKLMTAHDELAELAGGDARSKGRWETRSGMKVPRVGTKWYSRLDGSEIVIERHEVERIGNRTQIVWVHYRENSARDSIGSTGFDTLFAATLEGTGLDMSAEAVAKRVDLDKANRESGAAIDRENNLYLRLEVGGTYTYGSGANLMVRTSVDGLAYEEAALVMAQTVTMPARTKFRVIERSAVDGRDRWYRIEATIPESGRVTRWLRSRAITNGSIRRED